MMDWDLPNAESLTVEFKSDRTKLSDKEFILAAVCLANTNGGVIYLGVENDGRPTGLHPDHEDITGMTAMIANRTVPPLSVRASVLQYGGHRLARVEVPRSDRLVATADGTL
jgi:ATP-dependent DNA helicase RecG